MQRLRVVRSRFFRNLYAATAIVLVLTACLIGSLVDQRLGSALEENLEKSLRNECELLSPFVVSFLLPGPGQVSDELQRHLHVIDGEVGLRVTVIRPDGVVIGDTDHDPARMANHGDRSEVRQALEDTSGLGVARRTSATVGFPMLYVARRLEGPSEAGAEPLGVVRVAIPVTSIAVQRGAARRAVVLGGAVGLLGALVLGLWFARRVAAPITEVTRVAEDLRAGHFERRIELEQTDEIGILADTMNRLGEEITTRIATISKEDAQLRAMLAGMVEGVIAVEDDDRILFCNQAAIRLLALPVAGVEGRRLWELAPVVELEELLAEARRTQALSRREIELHRTGRERVLDAHASPFRTDDARGLVVVLHDVSDLRRLERIRRDFVANVSHELKTPLTSIKGFVETLLSGAIHDEGKNEHFLQRVDANVDRLSNLVTDLLSLARIESQEAEPLGVPVAWRPIVEGVLGRHEERLAKKAIRVTVDENAPTIEVQGDAEAMTQVAENLIDNAIKYSPGPGKIAIRIAAEGEHVVLCVRDDGVGIPREDQERVFERFYRVDKARSQALGGTGLGLSIVKHLVVAMRGEVDLESEPGRGSAFSVRLPRAS